MCIIIILRTAVTYSTGMWKTVEISSWYYYKKKKRNKKNTKYPNPLRSKRTTYHYTVIPIGVNELSVIRAFFFFFFYQKHFYVWRGLFILFFFALPTDNNTLPQLNPLNRIPFTWNIIHYYIPVQINKKKTRFCVTTAGGRSADRYIAIQTEWLF